MICLLQLYPLSRLQSHFELGLSDEVKILTLALYYHTSSPEQKDCIVTYHSILQWDCFGFLQNVKMNSSWPYPALYHCSLPTRSIDHTNPQLLRTPANMPKANPIHTPIPLNCTICAKKPQFSDVSHLLTHVSSKAHLAVKHNLGIKSQTDQDAGQQLQDYQAWYNIYNIAGLLAERMAAKENKANGVKNKKIKASILEILAVFG